MNRHSDLSTEQKILKIAEYASQRQDAATRAMDSALKTLEQGLKALDESLNKDIQQVENAGSINGEIREHMKGLKPTERLELLNSAFEMKDLLTLRAVLSGPALLSGITEDERKLRVQMFWRLTQPELAQRADVMRAARDHVLSKGPLILTQIESAMGWKWSKVQQAKERAKKVADALKIA